MGWTDSKAVVQAGGQLDDKELCRKESDVFSGKKPRKTKPTRKKDLRFYIFSKLEDNSS